MAVSQNTMKIYHNEVTRVTNDVIEQVHRN